MLEKKDYQDFSGKLIEEGFYQHRKDRNKIYYFTGEWNTESRPMFRDFDGKGTIVLRYDHVGELERIGEIGVKKIASRLTIKATMLKRFL